MAKQKSPNGGNRSCPIAPSTAAALRRSLHTWYMRSRRDLPWRKTSDPYKIWISEVMLQQTQVKTALPYYLRFIDHFPDLFHLAQTDQQAVLKLWEGLGYYSRARNLHRAANIIVTEMGGHFPDSWDRIMQLPGIGDYIGSAVLSIAFGKPHAVADGNVKRVLARVFQIEAPANQPASHGLFKNLAISLLDRENPGDHNQALMELGALICTPRRPECNVCPLDRHCRALRSNRVADFPYRAARAPVPQRHVAVGVVIKKGRILLVQRDENGLLGGLWEFPGGRVESGRDPAKACRQKIKSVTNLEVTVNDHLITVRHTYTHFKLRMEVYRCRWKAGRIHLRGPAGFKWVHPARIADYPLHGAMHKALSKAYLSLGLRDDVQHVS